MRRRRRRKQQQRWFTTATPTARVLHAIHQYGDVSRTQVPWPACIAACHGDRHGRHVRRSRRRCRHRPPGSSLRSRERHLTTRSRCVRIPAADSRTSNGTVVTETAPGRGARASPRHPGLVPALPGHRGHPAGYPAFRIRRTGTSTAVFTVNPNGRNYTVQTLVPLADRTFRSTVRSQPPDWRGCRDAGAGLLRRHRLFHRGRRSARHRRDFRRVVHQPADALDQHQCHGAGRR